MAIAGRLLALVLGSVLAGAGPVRAGIDSPWRAMELTDARRAALPHEVARAVTARWKRMTRLEVSLDEPRLLTDGTRFRLHARGGRVAIREGRLGNLPIRAELALVGPFSLDYAALGVGRLELDEEAHVKAEVTIDFDDIRSFLARERVVDVGLSYDRAASELEVWGARPFHILFFKLVPRMRIRTTLYQRGTVVGAEGIKAQITGIPGFLARMAASRIQEMVGKPIELKHEYAKLARGKVRFLGGSVTLMGEDGPIMERQVPGDPELARVAREQGLAVE